MRKALVLVLAGVFLFSGVAGASVAQVGPGPTAPSEPDVDDDHAVPNASVDDDSRSPQLVELFPDPYADGDAGEYVVLSVPEPTNATGWTIRDEAGTVAELPNRTIEGTVVLSTEPEAVESAREAPTRKLDGRLRLANGGDVLALQKPDGTVVSRVGYDRAREGERYRRTAEGWEWYAPGTTEFEPVETSPQSATAFVLPDAPDVVESELQSADERIYLAGYTLTSDRVVEALLDARDRDVEVRVLLEGSPVGGTSQRQAEALDRLSDAGVPVTVLAGERDPFGVHHAKYAVIDDRALVLTENFKPAGTGGRSSRGWGVVVEGAETADALAEVFHADSTGPGSTDWQRHRRGIDTVPGGASKGTYPSHFEPATVDVVRARILVSPDNARPELAALLRSANDSIRIQQMRIDGPDDPLLRASIDAARNGTEVEILLSSARYAEAENRALANEIEQLADREELPISATVVDPRGRFSKVHAKVAIVDDRHVVLGSLNWNEAAYEENREVVVVLTGEEVADYYTTVFEADAREEPFWRLPTGLAGAVVALWIVLGLLAIARLRWAA